MWVIEGSGPIGPVRTEKGGVEGDKGEREQQRGGETATEDPRRWRESLEGLS